jgi:O-acetylhomoserine (thiol)-lyase
MDNLAMVRRATNLNDNKSLVLHPASTIFADYTVEQRDRMQVNERLIRLSVGIEDAQDIIDDIQQGLEMV